MGSKSKCPWCGVKCVTCYGKTPLKNKPHEHYHWRTPTLGETTDMHEWRDRVDGTKPEKG